MGPEADTAPGREAESARRDEFARLQAAAVVSFATSDVASLFGVPAIVGGPSEPAPIVQIAQWQWADPLSALLRMGGWEVDEVLRDPAAARSFGALWDALKAIDCARGESERRADLERELWWRRQGCPVACPFCGGGFRCGCPS